MSSLRPVDGTASEILGLLRDWDAAPGEPPPLLVETSGSTGTPKRVVLSRSAMRASALATNARLGGPGQWLLNLPPGYVAGLQALYRSVVAGTEPVVAEGSLAESMAQMTGSRRYISLVPTQLTRLLHGDQRDDQRDVEALSRFDAVLVGGAPAPDDLRQAAARSLVRVVTTYGMSETCGGCIYDGVPLDGVAVSIGHDGRVRIRGPVLFDGYDGQPGLTAEVKQDGWFTTQDLGCFDDGGRLRVLGRVDDVIVSGGVNVPARAVADRLRDHPAVRDVEVVGVPDSEWGQRVAAVVVEQPGHGADLDELRDWVAQVHPRAWAPLLHLPVAALPLLHNGKVDRRAVERLAGGETRTEPDAAEPAGAPVREG